MTASHGPDSQLRGRPLRALAGLGLMLALWIAVRVPAMQAELAWLSRRAAPPLLARRAASGRPSVWPSYSLRPLPRPALPPHSTLIARAARPGGAALPLVVPPMPAATPGPLVPPAAPLPVPPPQPPPPATLSPTPVSPADPAHDLATQAYRQARAGQRRQAAALFDQALALQPGNRQWRRDRRALGQRWQLGGYALARDGGAAGPAASPVLGGGQIGGSLAFLPDPYADRPFALVARATAAADGGGVRRETVQLAIGLRQALLPGVSLAVERLVPLGDATRAAFTARLAAGGRWQRLEGYGEAGVLDTGQVYAGGQARARLVRLGPLALHAASWASLQTGAPDVWRVDVGPSLGASIRGIRIEADWRQRVGGNAAPGSGPVLTVSAGF